jgi:hypothetical protein
MLLGEMVWNRIQRREGESFETITGLPFNYVTDGNGLFILRAGRPINRRLTRSQVLKATDRCPLAANTDLRDCLGYSYTYAILMDSRIRHGLW